MVEVMVYMWNQTIGEHDKKIVGMKTTHKLIETLTSERNIWCIILAKAWNNRTIYQVPGKQALPRMDGIDILTAY
jgi:hypothetical protein